ncbi:energy-coupling factor transporter transmembrane component T [Halococcus sp. PRR34]|uniref:energy-coupling factor transporter transmembrane component T family protein n=1 Tax=Halococcus sp. PRR34 TaxID=3020830 RepID=UPI002361FC49|nr:energy-coupling factor transporter transmembrane component T [Halococcus sp. PRR34]
MTERPDPEELLEQSGSNVGGVVEYHPGSSLLHRLNPVTKLVIAVGLAIAVFLLPTYQLPFLLAAALLLASLAEGVFRSVATVVIVILVPLTAFLLPVQALFYPQNQTPLYVLTSVPVVGQLTIWREGVEFALLIIGRLSAVIIAMLMIFTTTHPKKLTDALMQKGMSNKLAYVFIAALQFIPQMRQRSMQILDAQQSRGLDTSANLLRRLRAVVELLSPLLISTLISTRTRALALESRGFTSESERTYIYTIPDTRLDRTLRWATAVGVVLVAAWVIVL